jgi:hypothetical protein
MLPAKEALSWLACNGAARVSVCDRIAISELKYRTYPALTGVTQLGYSALAAIRSRTG